MIDTGEPDADGHALVVLRGRAPVLAGWTLAAIVYHRDGVATVRPAGEQGERLATGAFAAANCEHCGLRRRRTNPMLSCVALAFLGGATVLRAWSLASLGDAWSVHVTRFPDDSINSSPWAWPKRSS